MTAQKSKYSNLSNIPLSKEFTGAIYDTKYNLPAWFTSSNRKKIIEVYGCACRYLESQNKELIPSSRYTNQFISVHSNIARDETENLKTTYPDASSFGNGESDSVDCFMMVVNNYYTLGFMN
jgi:hypothetical protein